MVHEASEMRVDRDLTQLGGINVGHDQINIANILSKDLPAIAALHQLPPDIPDFAGRNAEFNELRDMLGTDRGADDKVAPVLAIFGKPGVGKSTLAIRLAHDLAPDFSDGQLYVDLRESEYGSAEPADVLGQLLRGLGVADRAIPEALNERVARFRSALAHKRILLLIDNAVDIAQVRPLIPANPACAVLITSRAPLAALEAAHLYRLDILAHNDAINLLALIAGIDRIAEEPATAGEVTRLCGYLPLAIRIAGARLRARPQWSVAHLAELLTAAIERDALDEFALGDREVRASINLSYQRLTRVDTRMFRLLGLLPASDFGVDLTAILVDTKVHMARASLERLLDAQLLEAALNNRYRFHDLVRIFVRERLAAKDEPRGEQLAALRRVAHWCIQKGISAQGMLPAGGFTQTERLNQLRQTLNWFEAERVVIIGILSETYRHQLWRLTCDLAVNLETFFELRAYWKDWQATSQIALAAAERLNDQAVEASVLYSLGHAHQHQAHWEEAISCYRRSLSIRRALGDRMGEAYTLNQLGVVYQRQGRLEEAITCFENSGAIRREARNPEGEAVPQVNLGLVYADQGRTEDAIKQYKRSLQTFRERGEAHQEAQVLNHLGVAYMSQGDWSDAISDFEKSLATFEKLGDPYWRGRVLMNMGQAQHSIGNNEAAEACWHEALSLLEPLEVPEVAQIQALIMKFCSSG